MARKVSYEQALVAHGWVALDPADIGLIESVYKKSLREGKERLMMAGATGSMKSNWTDIVP